MNYIALGVKNISIRAALLVLIGFEQSYASCLSQHIAEAIHLNQSRREVYSVLSNRRSLPISDALIAMELELRWKSRLGDWVSTLWRIGGVALLCEEVIPMSATPAFKASYEDQSPLKNLTLQPELWEMTIKVLLKEHRYQELEQWSHGVVEYLEQEPRAYCLSRHFMESIRRSAGLAPLHAQKAADLSMGDTLWISRRFIEDQAYLLAETHRIDQMAQPLNAQGLPIICQDVPSIPRVRVSSESEKFL